MTVREVVEEYHESIAKAKDKLTNDLQDILTSMGMWDVDVIRLHDKRVGRFKIAEFYTHNFCPEIQFYGYNYMGQLGKNCLGRIPTVNTEDFIKKNFKVFK